MDKIRNQTLRKLKEEAKKQKDAVTNSMLRDLVCFADLVRTFFVSTDALLDTISDKDYRSFFMTLALLDHIRDIRKSGIIDKDVNEQLAVTFAKCLEEDLEALRDKGKELKKLSSYIPQSTLQAVNNAIETLEAAHEAMQTAAQTLVQETGASDTLSALNSVLPGVVTPDNLTLTDGVYYYLDESDQARALYRDVNYTLSYPPAKQADASAGRAADDHPANKLIAEQADAPAEQVADDHPADMLIAEPTNAPDEQIPNGQASDKLIAEQTDAPTGQVADDHPADNLVAEQAGASGEQVADDQPANMLIAEQTDAPAGQVADDQAADKRQLVTTGKAEIGDENQSAYNGVMVARVDSYNGGSYSRQLNNQQSVKLHNGAIHKEIKKLEAERALAQKVGDMATAEVLEKQIGNTEAQIAAVPPLTLVSSFVLNFSDRRWSKRSKQLINIVGDYPQFMHLVAHMEDIYIPVFDVAFLPDSVIEQFQTDVRPFFRFVKDFRIYKEQRDKGKVPDDFHVDLSGVTNKARMEKILDAYIRDYNVDHLEDELIEEKMEENMLLYTSRKRADLKASIRTAYDFLGGDKEAIRSYLLSDSKLLKEQFQGVSNRDFDSCWDDVMALYGLGDDVDDDYDIDYDDYDDYDDDDDIEDDEDDDV